jgi:hypothetical protein
MNIRKRTWSYNGKKSTAWLVDWKDKSGRHRQQSGTPPCSMSSWMRFGP